MKNTRMISTYKGFKHNLNPPISPQTDSDSCQLVNHPHPSHESDPDLDPCISIGSSQLRRSQWRRRPPRLRVLLTDRSYPRTLRYPTLICCLSLMHEALRLLMDIFSYLDVIVIDVLVYVPIFI